MKKELKGFICGVVATTLVAGGAAFAAGQWKTIDVLENDITVMVDGKQVAESNFVYNDRTYLPLRAVAEAVGKPVDYDTTTNTAYIGQKIANSSTGPTEVRLTNTFTTTSDGLYIYEDEAKNKYLKVVDINSKGSDLYKESLTFVDFRVYCAKNRTNWLLTCIDYTNSEMWDVHEIYGMEGGTAYSYNDEYFITASDYTEIVLPNAGFSTIENKPYSSKLQVIKDPIYDK